MRSPKVTSWIARRQSSQLSRCPGLRDSAAVLPRFQGRNQPMAIFWHSGPCRRNALRRSLQPRQRGTSASSDRRTPRGPVPVLFFPEGTSTDGTQLLRFHSRFYTPAVDADIAITTAAIRYIPGDNSPESDLCWYGDAAFLPHVWKTLAAPDFSCELTFGEPRIYTRPPHCGRRNLY